MKNPRGLELFILSGQNWVSFPQAKAHTQGPSLSIGAVMMTKGKKPVKVDGPMEEEEASSRHLVLTRINFFGAGGSFDFFIHDYFQSTAVGKHADQITSGTPIPPLLAHAVSNTILDKPQCAFWSRVSYLKLPVGRIQITTPFEHRLWREFERLSSLNMVPVTHPSNAAVMFISDVRCISAASSDFDAQQDLYDTTRNSIDFEPGGIIHSIPSNATVVCDQVAFHYDFYEASGSGKAMFELIRNNHEFIVWGPPIIKYPNLTVQLELIRCSILHGTPACPIPLGEKHFQIPYLGGYRCVEESQLKITDWLQAGWKLALFDGVRPVEVEYAYNLTSLLALQYMINGCRDLEPLDLTTSVLACLARDGHLIGLVKFPYKDRRLVYSAFQKMQEHNISLLDGHGVDLCGFNSRRQGQRRFSQNAFIYDRMVYDKQELKQGQQAHWRQVELLFERLNTYPGTSHRYLPREYRILNILSVPRMSFLTFSACPSVGYKRQKKHRQRSNERQIFPDATCDGEDLHGRDRAALTRRRRILSTRHECVYDSRPDSHCIFNSETSISSLTYGPCSPTTGTPQHHQIFYSDHSSPSPFYLEGDILESGRLEEIESGCSS
ncbi:hypothetical protein IW261DRAFT_1427784 [Armillaria novae-zelandiae]|uniref:Uncharacterized protein n=1 Tax=Armillaria novae-zelandiae TaxID=153914 RepID=A0AA39NCZ9_9AGAR|nr:hypothetical protein IW261DRAFT_1427784 [Armillaria novae-zelandiae]